MTHSTTAFQEAVQNFSDTRHDDALEIAQFDDHPSEPADMAEAEARFIPGAYSEQEIIQEASLKTRALKWGGGLAVAGVLAFSAATGGFDKDPEPRQLTQTEKQAVMNHAAEQQFLADAQNH